MRYVEVTDRLPSSFIIRQSEGSDCDPGELGRHSRGSQTFAGDVPEERWRRARPGCRWISGAWYPGLRGGAREYL
jgi:hypothetical protein